MATDVEVAGRSRARGRASRYSSKANAERAIKRIGDLLSVDLTIVEE